VNLEKIGYKIDSPAFALAQQQLQEQEERQLTQQVATQHMIATHQLPQQAPYMSYRYGQQVHQQAASQFPGQPRAYMGAAPGMPQQQALYYQSQQQQPMYSDHQYYGGHSAPQMINPHHPPQYPTPQTLQQQQQAAYLYQQAPMVQAQPQVPMHHQPAALQTQMQDPA